MVHLGVAISAYLLGSIPTGYLFARARGIDIRTVGSGNIGATNVFRILGKTAGTLVLLADALKGFLACALVAGWGVQFGGEADPSSWREQLSLTAGIAAILGHNYTCWLRFKGGKGIATSAGVLVALWPWAFLITLSTWLIIFAISRYVSLASLAAALILPFATWRVGQSRPMILAAAALGALAIYKHKANIQRLLNGTEHRAGAGRSGSPPVSPSS